MRLPKDGAEADDRFGEPLPIEGAPAVWHDEPPPDDYHVEVADGEPTDDVATGGSAPLFADPVTLRPARRTGGIRTSRLSTPAPPADLGTSRDPDDRQPLVDADARPAPRPPYVSGRQLPRVGTEALGRCVRLERYGAFVDFSGHRGLIHISQLNPGYRVERVEDVIAVGDDVVVRVISVDQLARHVNLTYVGRAPISSGLVTRPMASTDVDERDVAVDGPSNAATRLDATDARQITAPVDAIQSLPTAPVAIDPVPVEVESTKQVVIVTDASHPNTAPTTEVAPVPAPIVETPPTPARGVEVQRVATRAREAQPTPTRPVPVPPPAPTVPRRSEIVGYVPGARVRPGVPPTPSAPTGGAKSPVRPTATPKAPEVARTGSRAMRRELDDPNHPMARFLAMSPDLGMAARPARSAPRPAMPVTPVEPEPEIAPEPPRMVPATRLVHADEPEPDLPMSDAPATIEALAARFGSKPASGTREVRPAPTSRSQAAREAQARMLEQLRRQG